MAGAGYQVGKGFTVSGAMATPTQASISGAGATTGTLTTGQAIYCRFTYVTANGETGPNPEWSITPSGSNNAIIFTAPAFPSGVTALNLYASTVSGQENLQGTINVSAGQFTLNSLVVGKPVPQWNTTSFQDINPSTLGLVAGSEFIVHNIYYNNPVAFGIWDGTTLVMFDSDIGNGVKMDLTIHCNANQWLRAYNQMSNTTLQVSFDGMQTV